MAHLTPKQAAFVREYLIDLNATQAAARAGFSARTANQQGARLMTNPDVRGAIDVAMLARSERTEIDADWVLKRLVDEAEADLADLYDSKTGALKPVHDWPLIWRKGLVQGIEVDELFEGRGEGRTHVGHVRKLKLDNRIKRIELIGKHVGVKAFEEQVAMRGLEGLADRLERIRQMDAREYVEIEIEADEAEPEYEPSAPRKVLDHSPTSTASPPATLPAGYRPIMRPAPAAAPNRPPQLPPVVLPDRPITSAYQSQSSATAVDYDPLSD
ncbi:terminase small subunit [Kaistia adipata]|uniref:terminase small subunit n=1 Tax=Kaistia adipata TaxID=166954 RepID=UPI000404E7CA|nr:terminase small subunit [Kaistia adipata]